MDSSRDPLWGAWTGQTHESVACNCESCVAFKQDKTKVQVLQTVSYNLPVSNAFKLFPPSSKGFGWRIAIHTPCPCPPPSDPRPSAQRRGGAVGMLKLSVKHSPCQSLAEWHSMLKLSVNLFFFGQEFTTTRETIPKPKALQLITDSLDTGRFPRSLKLCRVADLFYSGFHPISLRDNVRA